MFATAQTLSLLDLAWQGPLHIGYSLSLLLYGGIAVVWFLRQHRRSRRQADELQQHHQNFLQRLQQTTTPNDAAAWPAFLREQKLYEVAAALEAGSSSAALDTLSSRWLTRTSPEISHPPTSPLLSPISLVALGLLGTLWGMQSAPSQPWSVALWPAFCGLFAASLGSVFEHLLQRTHQILVQQHQHANTQRLAWFEQEILPQLPIHRRSRGVHALEHLQRTLAQFIDTQSTTHPTSDLLAALTQQQEHTQRQLEQILQSLQMLHVLPQLLQDWSAPFERAEQSLRTWCATLDGMDEKLQRFSRILAEGLEPIAHSERLLSERIAALSRHYVALSDMLERIEQHERLLPQRTADLMKLSLRPAHQLLQRASLSLVGLLEQSLNQQTREREGWRRLMGEMNERLNSFDRLTHAYEKMNHELSSVADTLTELSTQIRFRPIIPTLNQEDTQNINEALETEIEQLLNDGFRDIQAPPPHDPS